MKNAITFLQKLTILFSGICLFFTTCNGQVKKDLPKEKVGESKIIAVGQQALIKTQSLNKGDNVHCSLQDKSGNLWFGTTGDGIFKYNGKSFTQFTTTNGLNSNSVNHMLEDKEGKIWIGTDAGLVLYDGKTFAEIQIPLRTILNLSPNKYRNSHNVFSIMQDKSGKLWFATVDGVYIYDGKSFNHFKVNEGEGGYMSSNNNVEYILEDKAGNIWFGGRGNKGVFLYDPSASMRVGSKSIINLKPDGDNFAWPVLQDKNGNIWFSNWRGAYRYDGKSFKNFTGNDSLAKGPITRIIEDKKGNLWFGGGGRGICRYDPARRSDSAQLSAGGKSFTCFTTKDGLIHNDVWSILEDRMGNIWIGSRETGLCRYNGKTFTSFSEKTGFLSIDK